MIAKHINSLKIKILKNKLNKAIESNDNLQDSYIYSISTELDRCIATHYKLELK